MNVLIVTMLNVSLKGTTYLHQSVTHKYVRINNKMKMKKLNKNDIAFLRHYIEYEHSPDIRELITQTAEL